MNTEEQSAIFPKGERANAEYFTGTAWVNTLVPKDETDTYTVLDVLFEPGCRNHWHTHARGQILLVTSGNGYYQERGNPARSLAKGDTVVIPSGVEHWHGAAKNSSLTHIAITNHSLVGAVQWLEPVSDEEYNSIGV